MIVRKPYAFLIKNFKIIHLILFALMAYILYKSASIYGFYNAYAKNGYYSFQADIQSHYTSLTLFISVLLILAIGFTVFYMLKVKEKPVKFYIYLLIYYFVLLVFLLICYSSFEVETLNAMDIRNVRAFRDISLLLLLPQFFFLIFSLIRGIGFDIKQFEFKKDLEELNIEVTDDEEVELVIKNTYKIPRFFRKLLRNIKYFIIEKRLLAIIIGIVIIIGISISLILNKTINKSEYVENDVFMVNGLIIKAIESYDTNLNYKGAIIDIAKRYLVIKVNVKNNTATRRVIETDKFVLITGSYELYPIFTESEEFLDLGDGYQKEALESGSNKDLLLIYEMNSEIKSSSYTLRVLNQISVDEDKVNATYKEIKLTPKNYNEIYQVDDYNLGEEILFGDSSLKKTSMVVNNYEISSSFDETFKYCASENCFDGKKIIKSDVVGRSEKLIIKLVTTKSIDKEISMSKYVKNSSSIFKYFGSIEYTINGNSKKSAISVITYSFINNDNVYIEVPVKIKDATNIKLYLTIRNARYSIILK